jgi:hypothetical protein
MIATALAALALAAPAAGNGCWATVQLSSMPTARTWNVVVRPLQHGFRALPAARPRIEIRAADASGWTAFRSRPTARKGYFRLHVVFPAAGTYRFRVWDGFEPSCARWHTYAPVEIP